MLEVYHRPYADKEVLVCLDETSKQLVKADPAAASGTAWDDQDLRLRIPAQGGEQPGFMLFAPLEGWRRVAVTERRTKADWAQVVRQLVDEDYPDKERIALVMDNPVPSTGQALNTHHPASLYQAFEPAEARRIAQRLEIHYTPKHGSWLNMAEIELGVLARQCLDRRIPDEEVLAHETEAWQDRRNRDTIRVDWRFTTGTPVSS